MPRPEQYIPSFPSSNLHTLILFPSATQPNLEMICFRTRILSSLLMEERRRHHLPGDSTGGQDWAHWPRFLSIETPVCKTIISFPTAHTPCFFRFPPLLHSLEFLGASHRCSSQCVDCYSGHHLHSLCLLPSCPCPGRISWCCGLGWTPLNSVMDLDQDGKLTSQPLSSASVLGAPSRGPHGPEGQLSVFAK